MSVLVRIFNADIWVAVFVSILGVDILVTVSVRMFSEDIWVAVLLTILRNVGSRFK